MLIPTAHTLQGSHVKILAVAIGVKAVVGVDVQHRFGVAVESVFGFGDLAEGGGKLNQQAAIAGLRLHHHVALNALPHAGFACPLWPSSTNTRLRESAEARHTGNAVALFALGEFVDVNDDDRRGGLLGDPGTVAVVGIDEHPGGARRGATPAACWRDKSSRGRDQDDCVRNSG